MRSRYSTGVGPRLRQLDLLEDGVAVLELELGLVDGGADDQVVDGAVALAVLAVVVSSPGGRVRSSPSRDPSCRPLPLGVTARLASAVLVALVAALDLGARR